MKTCTFCGQPDEGNPADTGWDRHGSVPDGEERMCLACRELVSLRTEVLYEYSSTGKCPCDTCRRYTDGREVPPEDWDPEKHWDSLAAAAAGETGRTILDILSTAIETVGWDEETIPLCAMLFRRQAWYLACAELGGNAPAKFLTEAPE